MIDYKKLKQLREETSISFSLCKKALEETNNDIEAAKKKLREWGAEKVGEKAARSTNAGALFSYIHHNKKIASVVELQCETDFVSGNREFQTLGQELAMQAASIPATGVESFLLQEYIREPSKKVGDLIKEAVLKFGENIRVSRLLRWELGVE
ncbi:elongation factor Ts [Candidatus Roizmanbacteria bacterium]|nr:elongation factor Ts [Candidatus Roizmanbacteria bacterium]